MDEAQLVYGFNRQRNLGHVESSDIFREDLILNQHGHQITTRQELHEHVQEGGVLEGCVQLDEPGAVRVGKDISLSADVCKLIFLVL